MLLDWSRKFDSHHDILISDMMERGEIANDIAVIAHVIEQVR